MGKWYAGEHGRAKTQNEIHVLIPAATWALITVYVYVLMCKEHFSISAKHGWLWKKAQLRNLVEIG